jgi:glycolate oxidase FAD binding subunit
MYQEDQSASLLAQVKEAIEQQAALTIESGGSKSFFGYPPSPELDRLDVSLHRGIIDYEPAELVMHVRAGTRLSEINQLLGDNNQLLPFEPPDFDATATIGGVIACGLSGPRRPWAGSARDYVLGVTLITGRGEILEFGGQVMKNVAGYDVSRLLTGSLGTLGIILDVSLKVLPAPEVEITRTIAVSCQEFQARLQSMQRNMPLSGAAYQDGFLKVRLSGSEAAVSAAVQKADGEDTDNGYWENLNTLKCFAAVKNLWRVSVAPASKLFLEDAAVIDWGGGIRWLVDPGYDPREMLAGEDGHATLMKYDKESLSSGTEIFQPLHEPLLGIHHRLKQQFDPAGIFNPGRMYRSI